jgi:Fe-S-cluster containining protein
MTEIQFQLTVNGHKIDAKVDLPKEPIRPVDLLPVLHALSNAIVGAVAEGAPVTCAKGCGACCRQAVPISETEAIQLRELIDDMTPDRKSGTMARFSETVRALKAAGIFDELNSNIPLESEEWTFVGRRYFALKLACPFLEDESCSIHESRPLACREYLAISDPKYCALPPQGKVETLVMPVSLASTLACFGDGIGRAPARSFPLTLLFEQQLSAQILLPAPELLENYFRAVTAPA